MKRFILLISTIIVLFCITGCGEKPDKYAEELEKYSLNNHLRCIKDEEKVKHQIDIFQDPKTYKIIFGVLTESYDIYPYDNNGKQVEYDATKELCSDYEKDTFSKCKAETYTVGLEDKINKARARYYYKLDVLNPKDEKDYKDGLKVLKELTEKDNYSCELSN